MDKNNLSSWVDERLAKLAPEGEWQPDEERALVRLNEQRAARTRRGRMWAWAAVAAAAACISLLVSPASRDVAHHFWGRSSHFQMVDMGQVSAALKTLKDGQAAPDFTLKDASGRDIRLSAYKGKVVLLNFWATWCGGCKTEIPWFIEFEQKYKDKGFEIIGVSMDDDGWKVVKPFLEEKKVNYAVVVGNDDMAKPYGLSAVSAMPMTFMIDRGGKVSAMSVGVVNKDACESEIVHLLGK